AGGLDAEVRGDEPGGTGEGAVAAGHLPDHRAHDPPRDPARPAHAVAHGAEGERARLAVADPPRLEEGPVTRQLHLGLEGGRLPAEGLHAGLDARPRQREAEDLALGRGRGAWAAGGGGRPRCPARGTGARTPPTSPPPHRLARCRPHRARHGPAPSVALARRSQPRMRERTWAILNGLVR